MPVHPPNRVLRMALHIYDSAIAPVHCGMFWTNYRCFIRYKHRPPAACTHAHSHTHQQQHEAAATRNQPCSRKLADMHQPGDTTATPAALHTEAPPVSAWGVVVVGVTTTTTSSPATATTTSTTRCSRHDDADDHTYTSRQPGPSGTHGFLVRRTGLQILLPSRPVSLAIKI